MKEDKRSKEKGKNMGNERRRNKGTEKINRKLKKNRKGKESKKNRKINVMKMKKRKRYRTETVKLKREGKVRQGNDRKKTNTVQHFDKNHSTVQHKNN